MFNFGGNKAAVTHKTFVERWTRCMEEAYRLARDNIRKASSKAKDHYDKRIPSSSVLESGDRVLVRNLSERGGPGKLRSFWEDKIYMVVRRVADDSPMYEVRPEHGEGRGRVLHRNLLLPCDFLILEQQDVMPEPIRAERQQIPDQEIPAESVSDSSCESAPWLLNPEAEPYLPDEMSWEQGSGVSTSAEAGSDVGSVTEQEVDELGSGSTASQSEGSGDQQDGTRPSRNRHPPLRMTYDTVGNPTYYPQMCRVMVPLTLPQMVPAMTIPGQWTWVRVCYPMC
jgi:hypothetical protein